jgi:hypothetical protein
MHLLLKPQLSYLRPPERLPPPKLPPPERLPPPKLPPPERLPPPKLPDDRLLLPKPLLLLALPAERLAGLLPLPKDERDELLLLLPKLPP